jgi:Zn-dependent protease with chaperone function
MPKDLNNDAALVPLKNGVWQRLLRKVQRHRLLSYSLKFLAITLVLLQSGLGITIAVVTSLQGSKAKTAVIILGAVNSFVGAIAAAMQWYGQPFREVRYYSTLSKIRDEVLEDFVEFQNPDTTLNPWDEGRRLLGDFNQANNDAWSSEPMVWIQGTKAPNGILDPNARRNGAGS